MIGKMQQTAAAICGVVISMRSLMKAGRGRESRFSCQNRSAVRISSEACEVSSRVVD